MVMMEILTKKLQETIKQVDLSMIEKYSKTIKGKQKEIVFLRYKPFKPLGIINFTTEI